MNFIDLHVHSSASDGTLTPAEVTALALEAGLAAYALTDHDTLDGIEEAIAAARGTALEVIPGTELSCPYEGKEIHLLGLCLSRAPSPLSEALHTLREARSTRNREMLLKLQRDGFSLLEEDLTEGAEHPVITRAHFARALLKKGYVTSMNQAFDRYLNQGRTYFLPKETLPPEEAIRLIRSAGGFPALAHPIQYQLGYQKTEELLAQLKEQGLMGVEVYYSSHNPGTSAKLREICRRLDLLPTGGSDFHGSNKPDIQLGRGRGGLRVSALLLSDIHERLGH